MNDVGNFSGFLTRPSPMSASFLVLSVGNFDQFLTPSSPPSSPSQMPTSFMDGPLRSQAFRRIMKYLNNSWQSYIVKTRKGNWKTEKLTNSFFYKKKTRPSSCQFFIHPITIFSTTYFVLCQAFFCSNNVWVLCIFFEAIKNWKIYPSLILTLPVSRCIT